MLNHNVGNCFYPFSVLTGEHEAYVTKDEKANLMKPSISHTETTVKAKILGGSDKLDSLVLIKGKYVRFS